MVTPVGQESVQRGGWRKIVTITVRIGNDIYPTTFRDYKRNRRAQPRLSQARG
jgi:hypothetical protein